MRHLAKFIPLVAVSSLLAACGSTSSSGSYAAPASQPRGATGSAIVKTASVSSLGGSVLVDAQGLTLYRLSGEQNGRWICTSANCVKAWHPLTAPTSGAPSGSVSSLGAVKRPGGNMQVTFQGMPLYTFVGDTTAGEAKGQGIKDVGVWTAVTGTGATPSKPATPAPSPAPASSSSGGGNSGY